MEDSVGVDFLDLPWIDILCNRILCFLSTEQIGRLQLVSKSFQELCLTYFRHCQIIDLTGSGRLSRFSGQAFCKLTDGNESLRVLNLKNCKRWVKDDILIPVLKRNSFLQVIDISGCLDVTNNSIVTLSTSCQGLMELHLSECRWLSSAALTQIGFNCHYLVKLTLRGCWNIDDVSLCTIVASNPNLHELDISDCYSITDIAVYDLAKCCRDLRYIGLKGCWRVHDGAIRLIGEYCSYLEKLDVKDCRDITDASLARLRARGVMIDVEERRYLPREYEHLQQLLARPLPILNLQI